MIRTQILNWCQSCRNRKVGTAVRFQPGQKPTVICPVRVTTRQDIAGRVFGRVWNRTEPIIRSKPGPLAGYPDPLLTLHLSRWREMSTGSGAGGARLWCPPWAPGTGGAAWSKRHSSQPASWHSYTKPSPRWFACWRRRLHSRKRIGK